MQNKTLAFIDEYGDLSIKFDKSGVSTFFIVSAIILDSGQYEKLKDQFISISKKHSQAPEIKSSARRFRNVNNRLSFLEDISKMDIKIFALSIDKRKIKKESGLAFNKSFYKFFNKMLSADLYKYYPNIDLVFDEHGSGNFMKEFVLYVQKHKPIRDLFWSQEYKFANSKDEPLIQIADFVSGSLARCLDPLKKIEDPNRIWSILEKQILHLRQWPEEKYNAPKTIEKPFSVALLKIINYNLTQITRIQEQGNNSIKLNAQTKTLNYLKFQFSINDNKYVSWDEIKPIISTSNYTYSRQVFVKDIIGELRDKGVIIVSSSEGYKLPNSVKDIQVFFNKFSNQIVPMINTLKGTNDTLRIASNGEMDILKEKEYQTILKLIEAMS